MKKVVLGLSFICFANILVAQNYFGMQSDTFGGLTAVSLNPANISGSNFRSEVNLASATVSFTNDYVSADLSNIFEDEIITGDNTSSSTNNNFNVSAEVMLPSFMLNISPKHSIGFISKVKAIVNQRSLSLRLQRIQNLKINKRPVNTNSTEYI